MFDSLQSQLGKLLGNRKDDDPSTTITADQLKVVLKSIEGKYNNLKNENKLYKSKIEEQKASIGELERAVMELKGGNGHAQVDSGLLTQLESDLNNAQQQMSEHQDVVANLRAEKLQLQSKLSVQEALVSSLRHEMSELREGHAGAASPEDHAKALADAEKLKFDNQQLQEKLQDLVQKLIDAEAIQPELVKKQQDLIAAQQELSEARTQTETAQQAKRQAEVERDGLSARLKPLVDELDTLRELVQSLTTERDNTGTELEATQAVLAGLKKQMGGSEEQLVQLQMDKDELKHQTTRQQTEIASLQEQLASGGPQAQVLADLEERLVDTKGRLEQAQAENLALQARLQQVMEEPSGPSAREKTEYEFQIKRLSDELREAMVQISSLREAKVKANLDLEEAAAELVELRRQLDDMRRDRNLFRERWEESRETQGEMDQLKGQMRELMTEMGRMRGGPLPTSTPEHKPARPVANRPTDLPLPRSAQAQPETPPDSRKASGGADAPGLSAAALERRRAMLNRLIGDKSQP